MGEPKGVTEREKPGSYSLNLTSISLLASILWAISSTARLDSLMHAAPASLMNELRWLLPPPLPEEGVLLPRCTPSVHEVLKTEFPLLAMNSINYPISLRKNTRSPYELRTGFLLRIRTTKLRTKYCYLKLTRRFDDEVSKSTVIVRYLESHPI